MKIGYIRSNFSKMSIGPVEGEQQTVETMTRADLCDALLELGHNLTLFGNTIKATKFYGEKKPLEVSDLPTLDLLLIEVATTFWQSKENQRIIEHYFEKDIPILVRSTDPDYKVPLFVRGSKRAVYLTFGITDNVLHRKAFGIPLDKEFIYLPYLALKNLGYPENLELAKNRTDYVFVGNYFASRIDRVHELFQGTNPLAKIYGKPLKDKGDYAEGGWEKMGFVDVKQVPEIFKTAWATTVIQKPLFDQIGLIGSRVTEPVMYGCLTFVDGQSRFLEPHFDSFYFVSTKYELQSKLNVVKRWNPETYVEKSSEQFNLLYKQIGWEAYKDILQVAIEEAVNT